MSDPLKREAVVIPPRISFSPKVRLQVLLKSNGRCASCNIKLAHRFDVDHIIPRANGGANSLGNLQALCVGCHGAKTPGDITCAAKAKRQSKMGDPKPESRIKSAKCGPRNRKFNGSVGLTRRKARELADGATKRHTGDGSGMNPNDFNVVQRGEG